MPRMQSAGFCIGSKEKAMGRVTPRPPMLPTSRDIPGKRGAKKGLLDWLLDIFFVGAPLVHTNPLPTTDPPASFLQPAGSLWEEPFDADSFTSFVTAGSCRIGPYQRNDPVDVVRACEYCGRRYRGEALECPGCRAPVSIEAEMRGPRPEPRLLPIG